MNTVIFKPINDLSKLNSGQLGNLGLFLSPITVIAAMGLRLAGNVVALAALFVLLSLSGLLLDGLGGAGKLGLHRLLFLMVCSWLLLGVLAVHALIANLLGFLNAGLTLVWWLMAAGATILGALAVTIAGPAAQPDQARNFP